VSILAIISLISSVAPKLISAGVSIYEIFNSATDIIKDAESNGGKVNPEAYAALVKKCDDIEALINKRAAEAQAELDRGDDNA